MAVRREDPVIRAQVALDGARLGRRFDDDEVLRHGRECSTGSCADPSLGGELGDRAPEVDGPKGAALRPRGCAGGSPRRSRGLSSSATRSRRPPRRPRRAARPGHRGPCRPATRGGISTNRTCRYGKKKTAVDVVDEDRALAVQRAHVRAAQRRGRRPAGARTGRRRRGCSLLRCRTAFRITAAWWPAAVGLPAADPMVPSRGGRSRRRGGRARRSTHTPIPTRSYLLFIMFT